MPVDSLEVVDALASFEIALSISMQAVKAELVASAASEADVMVLPVCKQYLLYVSLSS